MYFSLLPSGDGMLLNGFSIDHHAGLTRKLEINIRAMLSRKLRWFAIVLLLLPRLFFGSSKPVQQPYWHVHEDEKSCKDELHRLRENLKPTQQEEQSLTRPVYQDLQLGKLVRYVRLYYLLRLRRAKTKRSLCDRRPYLCET